MPGRAAGEQCGACEHHGAGAAAGPGRTRLMPTGGWPSIFHVRSTSIEKKHCGDPSCRFLKHSIPVVCLCAFKTLSTSYSCSFCNANMQNPASKQFCLSIFILVSSPPAALCLCCCLSRNTM